MQTGRRGDESGAGGASPLHDQPSLVGSPSPGSGATPAVLLDLQFIERSRRVALGLGVLACLTLVQTLDSALVGGVAAGVLMGVASVEATAWAVRKSFGAAQKLKGSRGVPARVVWGPLGAGAGKLVLLFLGMQLVLGRWSMSPLGMALGLSAMPGVMALKAMGRAMGAPAVPASGA